jgi:hypothetical protein
MNSKKRARENPAVLTRETKLTLALLVVGIVVGGGISALIAFTLDKGKLSGPAFSLAHHYPETIGFFILSLGMGIGFKSNVRKLIKVASIIVLVVFTFLAILQTKEVLISGVPEFIPLIILLGLVIGYITACFFA